MMKTRDATLFSFFQFLQSKRRCRILKRKKKSRGWKEERGGGGGRRRRRKGRVRIELCYILQYDPGEQRAITTL
jgi:hypothetical protein